MFETVISVNPNNVLAANALRSRYTCHQATTALAGEKAGVLWRLTDGDYPKLTVRTSSRPKVEAFLLKRPGYCVSVDCRAFDFCPESGKTYRFYADVNPTKKVHGSGHRRAIEGDNEIKDWWLRTMKRFGAEVADIAVLSKRSYPVYGRQGGFRLFVARLTGVICIRDPEVIQDAVRSGIGKGKAFGCGLLVLKKSHIEPSNSADNTF